MLNDEFYITSEGDQVEIVMDLDIAKALVATLRRWNDYLDEALLNRDSGWAEFADRLEAALR